MATKLKIFSLWPFSEKVCCLEGRLNTKIRWLQTEEDTLEDISGDWQGAADARGQWRHQQRNVIWNETPRRTKSSLWIALGKKFWEVEVASTKTLRQKELENQLVLGQVGMESGGAMGRRWDESQVGPDHTNCRNKTRSEGSYSLHKSRKRNWELAFKMPKERHQTGVGSKDLQLKGNAGDRDGKSDKPTLWVCMFRLILKILFINRPLPCQQAIGLQWPPVIRCSKHALPLPTRGMFNAHLFGYLTNIYKHPFSLFNSSSHTSVTAYYP